MKCKKKVYIYNGEFQNYRKLKFVDFLLSQYSLQGLYVITYLILTTNMWVDIAIILILQIRQQWLAYDLSARSKASLYIFSIKYSFCVIYWFLFLFFSSVFSLWKLLFCHCWNFPNEKHLHNLFSPMQKKKTQFLWW